MSMCVCAACGFLRGLRWKEVGNPLTKILKTANQSATPAYIFSGKCLRLRTILLPDYFHVAAVRLLLRLLLFK